MFTSSSFPRKSYEIPSGVLSPSPSGFVPMVFSGTILEQNVCQKTKKSLFGACIYYTSNTFQPVYS